MDIYDSDERERETNQMELIIDGLTIEIPENLIQERMDLMDISREKVEEMIYKQIKEYKECLLFNKKYNRSVFAQKFIDYLDSELAIYRP